MPVRVIGVPLEKHDEEILESESKKFIKEIEKRIGAAVEIRATVAKEDEVGSWTYWDLNERKIKVEPVNIEKEIDRMYNNLIVYGSGIFDRIEKLLPEVKEDMEKIVMKTYDSIQDLKMLLGPLPNVLCYSTDHMKRKIVRGYYGVGEDGIYLMTKETNGGLFRVAKITYSKLN